MDCRARAQELVTQLGDEIGIEGLAFDEDGVIDLDFEDGLRVSLGLDPGAEAILLLGPLLGPTAGLDRKVLLRLLQTGDGDGPMVALDDGNDRLCLQERCRLAGMDYATFKERFTAFMAAQEDWMAELEPEIAAAETVSGRLAGSMDGMIRA